MEKSLHWATKNTKDIIAFSAGGFKAEIFNHSWLVYRQIVSTIKPVINFRLKAQVLAS